MLMLIRLLLLLLMMMPMNILIHLIIQVLVCTWFERNLQSTSRHLATCPPVTAQHDHLRCSRS
jgi:hypothetical protein